MNLLSSRIFRFIAAPLLTFAVVNGTDETCPLCGKNPEVGPCFRLKLKTIKESDSSAKIWSFIREQLSCTEQSRYHAPCAENALDHIHRLFNRHGIQETLEIVESYVECPQCSNPISLQEMWRIKRGKEGEYKALRRLYHYHCAQVMVGKAKAYNSKLVFSLERVQTKDSAAPALAGYVRKIVPRRPEQLYRQLPGRPGVAGPLRDGFDPKHLPDGFDPEPLLDGFGPEYDPVPADSDSDAGSGSDPMVLS